MTLDAKPIITYRGNVATGEVFGPILVNFWFISEGKGSKTIIFKNIALLILVLSILMKLRNKPLNSRAFERFKASMTTSCEEVSKCGGVEEG